MQLLWMLNLCSLDFTSSLHVTSVNGTFRDESILKGDHEGLRIALARIRFLPSLASTSAYCTSPERRRRHPKRVSHGTFVAPERDFSDWHLLWKAS